MGRPKTKVAPEQGKNVILCGHCGQDSGWTPLDLAPIRGDHDLKCQQKNCGLTAIKHRNSFTASVLPAPKEKEIIPWGQRGTGKYVKKNANKDLF